VSPAIRWTGALRSLSAEARQALLDRGAASGRPDLREQVHGLLLQVRNRGDAALREFAQRFDGVTLDSLEVSSSAIRTALERQPVEVRRAMDRSVRNIDRVHAACRPAPIRVEVEPGVTVERRPDPLARVGLYAPGGRAAYPSSVLMGAIPARVAGVREVVLCSPPSPTGRPADVILAAAAVAEVDRVFALGGAGAVGAMGFGTETVPRVDRIIGPGNAWVAEAKLQISGRVAMDLPAGPSELLVLLDSGADVGAVARELLAQAEHDPEAAVVALALGEDTARRLAEALLPRVGQESRSAIISEALARRGALLSTTTLEEAIAFAEDWAPEHLMLAIEDAERIGQRIRNAGTVFVGTSSSGAFGDYSTGANHVLPTGGAARGWSGLSTLDFVRWTTVQTVSTSGAAALAADTEVLATAEGLPAHAAAARRWRSS
jgi:histidinol dehydrogenase